MIIAITLTSDGHSVNWELSFSEFRRFICIFFHARAAFCIALEDKHDSFRSKMAFLFWIRIFKRKYHYFENYFWNYFWNSGLIPTFLPLNKKGYFWHWNSLLRINLYRVYPIQRNDCLLSLERRIVLEWTTWIDLRFSI